MYRRTVAGAHMGLCDQNLARTCNGARAAITRVRIAQTCKGQEVWGAWVVAGRRRGAGGLAAQAGRSGLGECTGLRKRSCRGEWTAQQLWTGLDVGQVWNVG